MNQEKRASFEYWGRNFPLLIVDTAVFMTALSLLDVSIISVFIIEATGSPFLAGLLQMLRSAGFYLTQLLSINVSSKPLKKKVLFKWTTLGRCSLIFVVLITLFTKNLQLIVFSFFVSLSLFPTLDGFSIVPWLEFVTKSCPPSRRGSFFGFSQFVGGLGMVAAGFLVSLILNESTFKFPTNYGILILIALILLIGGVLPIILLKEKPDTVAANGRSLLETLKNIPSILREDEVVKQLVLIQLLISFYSLATPFYSVYALSKMGLEDSYLGIFLSVQMLGRLAASFLWGYLANKGLNKTIIQLTGFVFLFASLIAILVGLVQFPSGLVKSMILLIFFLIGVSMGGVFLGFTNYVMDVKDNTKRPILLGFLNFLNVATSILPVIGGMIVEQLPYEVIFVSSAIPIGFALVLTRQLNEKIDD